MEENWKINTISEIVDKIMNQHDMLLNAAMGTLVVSLLQEKKPIRLKYFSILDTPMFMGILYKRGKYELFAKAIDKEHIPVFTTA